MTPEDKAFAEAWYGTTPIEVMAKSSGWGEARIRTHAIYDLRLGPRTTETRDWLSRDYPNSPSADRRKEVGL